MNSSGGGGGGGGGGHSDESGFHSPLTASLRDIDLINQSSASAAGFTDLDESNPLLLNDTSPIIQPLPMPLPIHSTSHRSSRDRDPLTVSVANLTPTHAQRHAHNISQPTTASSQASIATTRRPSSKGSFSHGGPQHHQLLHSNGMNTPQHTILPMHPTPAPPLSAHGSSNASVSPSPKQNILLASSPVLLSPGDSEHPSRNLAGGGGPHSRSHQMRDRDHSTSRNSINLAAGGGLLANHSPAKGSMQQKQNQLQHSSMEMSPLPPSAGTPNPFKPGSLSPPDPAHARNSSSNAPDASSPRSRHQRTPSSSTSSHTSHKSSSSSSASSRLRHSEEGRKCCFCIPWSSNPNKRLSFVTIMVILVVGQVVVSCVLVWLLGYLSTISTVATLTNTIRQSIMHDVSFELNTAMAEPLRAAYDIDELLRLKFPDITTRTSITNEPGWLAQLSYVALRYPSLSRVGFATRNGIYVLITKGINELGEAESVFSASAGNMTISLAEPSFAPNSTVPTVTLYNFRPSAIRPNTNAPPFQMTPEILPNDSPQDIMRYLGPNITASTVYGFSIATRPFYQAAVDVNSQGLASGWSNVYSSSNIYVPGSYFLAIAAVHATPTSANDTTLGLATFAVTNLDNLNNLLKGLPLGNNGFGYFIRTNGRVVSSSLQDINDRIKNSVSDNSTTSLDLNMFTSNDDWLQILVPVLLEWNLITRLSITPRNSSLVVPYRQTVYETSVSYHGGTYHIQATMLTNTTSGLPLSAVIITKDSDFDADVRANIINTIVLSLVVALVAIIVSFLVTRCISRPMMVVVDYMERSCKIIEMDRSEKQRKELSALCEEWSDSSGMVLPPLLTSSAFVSMVIKDDPERVRRRCACLDNKMGCTDCGGIGRSLREVQSMHRAFGSMLYSLASYDELEAINHAKRQFIRYIFHEVRVPFNAIVLGIEQMEMELREQSAMQQTMSGALDTLSIISEQSQVVSRILNDVLSMQKIEDGALTLEYDVFSMEKMIRGSLYAFRSPCMDKRIKVKVDLANIDEFIGDFLPGFRLGQMIIPGLMTEEALRHQNGVMLPPAAGSDAALRQQSSGSYGLQSADGGLGGRASSVMSSILGGHGTNSNSTAKKRSKKAYMHRAYVRGDPYRLRQVFSNLITNAIKFSPQQGRIHVSLEISNFIVSPFAAAANASLLSGDGKYTLLPLPSPPSTPPVPATPMLEPMPNMVASTTGTPMLTPAMPPSSVVPPVSPMPLPLPEILGTLMVRVSVKDSGPGVPASEAPHLFQAYMQVSAGKTQKGNGTGLGLSISKSIVELHGGVIGFNSSSTPVVTDSGTALGGAEFFFTIPLDVSLVKSRSGHRHGSSASGSRLGGSMTFSSVGESASTNDVGISSSVRFDPTVSTSNAPPRNVNFADANGPLASTEEETLEESTLLNDTTMSSPHVGLVHRTHTISVPDPTKSQLKSSSKHATSSSGKTTASSNFSHDPTMLNALGMSSSPRAQQPRTKSPSNVPSNVAASVAAFSTGTLQPSSRHLREPLTTTKHRAHPSDSVVDIAPLAESGIGSDGETETSVSRIRFHDDINGIGSRDRSRMSQDGMDPTRGDWDHIEQAHAQGRIPTPNAISTTPLLPEHLNANVSPQTLAGTSSVTTPPESQQKNATLRTTSPPGMNGAVQTYLTQTTVQQQQQRASPDNGITPILSPSELKTMSSGGSNASTTASSGMHRPIPPQLAVPSGTPPTFIPAGNGSSAGGANSGSTASVINLNAAPLSTNTARATHAIDLASFISEETKAQHKASLAAASLAPAWAPVNLSPAAPLGEGGGSSPSTPYQSAVNSASVAAAATSAKKPTSVSSSGRGSAKTSGFKPACRVLVVEDSLPNRKLLVSLLGRLKCVASGVEDGQQCIDLFQTFMTGKPQSSPQAVAATTAAATTASASPPSGAAPINSVYPFDIILMDGSMPVMNGVVATQILRSHGITVPIIAVTGNALSEDQEAFRMAGANDVLTKPINIAQLTATLASYVPAPKQSPNAGSGADSSD